MDFGIDYAWTIEATLSLAHARPPVDALTARDIIAQEGMHRAADWMVVLTVVQLIVAAITAGGLLVSLWMTNRALKHSYANIELGRATLEATRASMNLELRAYLGLLSTKVSVLRTGTSYAVQIEQRIKNFGNTTTVAFAPYGQMFLVKATPGCAKAMHFAPRLKAARQLMPGQECTHITRLGDLAPATIRKIQRGEWCILFAFRIRYETAFASVAGLQLGRETVHWGEDLAQLRPLRESDEDDQWIAY